MNGQIDLGALTAEFLALGLDPYPRKPGVDFSYQDPADEKDSPFAALGKLKGERVRAGGAGPCGICSGLRRRDSGTMRIQLRSPRKPLFSAPC